MVMWPKLLLERRLWSFREATVVSSRRCCGAGMAAGKPASAGRLSIWHERAGLRSCFNWRGDPPGERAFGVFGKDRGGVGPAHSTTNQHRQSTGTWPPSKWRHWAARSSEARPSRGRHRRPAFDEAAGSGVVAARPVGAGAGWRRLNPLPSAPEHRRDGQGDGL
jgi:hypothetical protein